MPQIDLITGLPGAGKTTFIKKYVQFLTGQGLTAAVLETDYGAVNLDMVILNDLIGDKCEVEILDGGSGVLPYSHRFHTKLSSMAVSGYDRVIVESFGFYDVDSFFDALAVGPLSQWYSPGSIVNIVDAGMEEQLSDEAQYLLVSQTASAGKIVLSHCGEAQESAGKEQAAGHCCLTSDNLSAVKEGVLARLNAVLERFQSDRRITPDDIIARDRDALTQDDFALIAAAGMVPADYARIPDDMRNGHGTILYSGLELEEEKVNRTIAEIFADKRCGKVMRVKGFVRTGDNVRIQVDATRHEVKTCRTPFAREVLIISGDELNEDRIDEILAHA